MDADTTIVVDHRSEEVEVLIELQRFLPGFSFGHAFKNEGECHVSMRFNGKEKKVIHGEIPHNCFRIILDAAEFLQPEAEIRIYEPTIGSDTHVFVVDTADFWSCFDREAPEGKKTVFLNRSAFSITHGG